MKSTTISMLKEPKPFSLYDDERSDFKSQKEYDHFLLARGPYTFEIELNENNENFVKIDAEKIEKLLK